MLKLISGLLDPRSENGFISDRFNLLLARAYSAALLLSGIEMSINALKEYNILNPFWFWLSWVLVVGPIVGLFLSSYFFDEQPVWYLLHVFGVIFTIATWPLQLGVSQELPHEFTPWVWWSLGMAAMSAGFGLKKPLGWTIIAALPSLWVVLRTSEYGGSADYVRAIADAVFSGLYSAVFTALVHVLKREGQLADAAMQESSRQAGALAAKNAAERERIRTTALIHERVLMTLDQAVQQKTKEQAKHVKSLAQAAVQSLHDWASDIEIQSIDANSCFEAIADSVRAQTDRFDIFASQEAEYLLGTDVAQTLTEATLEAVTNALQHSKANTFELRMSATSQGVKVVVKDDGRGFFQSRVPKSKMGVRTIIRAALESIGGSAKIQSLPEFAGTVVVLEWRHE